MTYSLGILWDWTDICGMLLKVLFYQILWLHHALTRISSVFSMCNSQQNLVLVILVVATSIFFLMQLCAYFNGQKHLLEMKKLHFSAKGLFLGVIKYVVSLMKQKELPLHSSGLPLYFQKEVYESKYGFFLPYNLNLSFVALGFMLLMLIQYAHESGQHSQITED